MRNCSLARISRLHWADLRACADVGVDVRVGMGVGVGRCVRSQQRRGRG
jgi:hypothetical protein